MTITKFTRALEHLTDEQLHALDRYFEAATAYARNIGECDEESYYISKCNAYDRAKELGISDGMMEV